MITMAMDDGDDAGGDGDTDDGADADGADDFDDDAPVYGYGRTAEIENDTYGGTKSTTRSGKTCQRGVSLMHAKNMLYSTQRNGTDRSGRARKQRARKQRARK